MRVEWRCGCGAVGAAIEAAPMGDGAAAAVKAAERVVGERPEAVARARDAREGNAGTAEARVSVARAPDGDRSRGGGAAVIAVFGVYDKGAEGGDQIVLVAVGVGGGRAQSKYIQTTLPGH